MASPAFLPPHPDLAPLAAQISAQLNQARADLAALVALPSVHSSADQAEQQACTAACELVGAQLIGLDIPGLGAEQVQAITTSDGSRAVFAHRPAAPGFPTVLLYSHYDVQPAGELTEWISSPWELTEREGRWFGRGAADCKGNFVVHLTALRALAAHDPHSLEGLGLRIVVEGSEETGGGGLDELIAEHPDLVEADVILIADSGNVAAGTPTLTTSLRGIANVVVTVSTLNTGVHSGQFGGAAPDALAALISILSSLRDAETGATTIDSLDFSGHWEGAPYEEASFRTDAGILDGVQVSSAAPIADLVWARPTATVLGIDCPPVEGSIAAVQPSARALINLRVPPGQDPVAAQDALVRHLEARRPWNAQLTVEREAVGYPFSTSGDDDPVHQLLATCLSQAYGQEQTAMVGSGGSIPLCTALQRRHPMAKIALFGVEDPVAAIHSPNESVDPREIERIALAEAAFLSSYAQESHS